MRIVLLLATLASTSLALEVPAKLHHIGGNKPLLVTHTFYSGNSTVDIQLYATLALVGTLGIGTPAQQFNLWFHDFVNGTWVFGEDAPSFPTLHGYQRHFFYPNKSATCNNTGAEYTGFFSGGSNVSDVISVPGTSLSARYTFGMADGVTMSGKNYFTLVPADGIVGIANTLPDSFLGTIGPQLDQHVMSLWIQGNTEGLYEQNASITLGGLDSAHCDADWFFAPETPYLGWTTRVSSVAVDGVEVSKSGVAGVVFMGLFILGPPDAVKPIVKLADGKPHPLFPFAFVVDCKKATVLPNVTFYFGEHPVTLEATDYVFKDPFPRAGGRCVLAFGIFSGPKRSVDMWAFGASFFNAHCFAFDWKEKKIGFATAKKPKSS